MTKKISSKEIQAKLAEAVKEYAGIGELAVEVGLPNDRIHEPSGMILSEVGAIHEFGVGGIPERSFLRGAVRDGKDEIIKAQTVIATKAANGESAGQLMESLALFGQGLVQEYISNGQSNFPPLRRPRKDGSSNPLNDTGALRQGIIGVVVSD